jgi:hypothetical protein
MSSRVELIREALRDVLGPLVATEGGLVYSTMIHEREIVVHYGGRLAGSPGASLIHNEFALPLIDAVAPGTIVHFSSGRLVPRDAEQVVPLPSESDSAAPDPAPSVPASGQRNDGTLHDSNVE